MHNDWRALVLSAVVFLLAGASTISCEEPTQSQSAEQAVWKLEHSYWDYVRDNNLAAYSGLWDEHFLGWPAQAAGPVGKDHITGWITSQTAKGLVFKFVEFKPARIQVTGNIVEACYWITFQWLDKDGKGDLHTLRITHTWLRDGRDWRIIAGMSMPEPAPPQH
jgi:hypothetical protein